ncbi:uncharacterized protein Eint_071270 [Encephalitozoon intestinalis ATCC 50506]|uniref:Uncharacterized protein n=1 Tax=Encephalitozoon intestinalis (strain ATCC 50506) TaxID=876142 RepID=E0S855_ENCIT|nr:uncharacterized protein Eint_071270 [Encephalitozoon intestinalis ATCC 50506]ADM11890.2 hypothetical protein Eint_071270 [Encephalitozoon intestinalis ATCC 50506]UTX45646.1 kinetochore protein MIS18 [Encephalitozoon intestinalis]
MVAWKDGRGDCIIRCFGCGNVVCRRARRAMLLSNVKIEVYSANVPTECVKCVRDGYLAYSCQCIVVDAECRCCRMILGYHILHPCKLCEEIGGIRHAWIFDTSSVISSIRRERSEACLNVSAAWNGEGDNEVKIR